MNFEVGKTYWTRNKLCKATVLDIRSDAEPGSVIAIRVFGNSPSTGGSSYISARFANGKLYTDETFCPWDLVEEDKEPLTIKTTLFFNVYKFPNNNTEPERLTLSVPFPTEQEARNYGKKSDCYVATVSATAEYTEPVPT